MIMENLQSRIAEILKTRRERAFINAERDYAEAKKYEDFAALDSEVRRLTLSTSFARSQGKREEKEERRLKAASAKRDKWLSERGLHITPVFTCPICKDEWGESFPQILSLCLLFSPSSRGQSPVPLCAQLSPRQPPFSFLQQYVPLLRKSSPVLVAFPGGILYNKKIENVRSVCYAPHRHSPGLHLFAVHL